MTTVPPQPLGIALLVTAATVVFGDFAQEMAGWIVCYGTPTGETCNEKSKSDAIMVATMISTMVGIVSATVISERTQASLRATMLTVAGALVAAYFTLLKAAAEGNDYPLWSRLDVASYIYVIVILLFALGPLALLAMGAGPGSAVALMRRIAIAILVGSGVGLVVHLAAEPLWQAVHAATMPAGAQAVTPGPGKFLVAPGATVVGTTAWGILILDPWLRRVEWEPFRHHRWVWIVGLFLAAVVLAAGYGALIYAGEARDWLKGATYPRWLAAQVDMVLILPGLTASTIVLIWLDRHGAITRALVAGALGAVIAWIGAVRIGGWFDGQSADGFAAIHTLAAAVCGGTILLSARAARRPLLNG